MIRKGMCWIVSLCMFFLNIYPTYTYAGSDIEIPQPTYEQAMQRIDQFMGLIKELRTHIDRSQFDLDALLDRLDYDADKIIKFITEEIYFEQYPGLLRGAKGTLMSRAGNALDQSVLLATLLTNAGFETQIARTTLPVDRTRELLRELVKERAPSPPLGDLEKIRASLKRLSGTNPEFDFSLEDLIEQEKVVDIIQASQVWKQSRQTGKALLETLSESSALQLFESAKQDLLKETADYYWVQYRLGPTEVWKDTHPAIESDWQNVAVQKVFTGSVPPELQHRVSLQAFITQRLGANVLVHPVMPKWERPAANLLGEPINFSILTMPIDPTWSWPKVREALPQSKMFFPLLNGSLAGEVAFDINGFVVPVDAAASPFAALFQELSGKLSSVAGALGALGKPKTEGVGQDAATPASLDELFLEITLVRPNGAEILFERRILAQGAQLSRGERARTLFSESVLVVNVGSYPEAFVLDLQLQDLLQKRPAVADAVAESFGVPHQNRQTKPSVRLPAGYLELFGLFDAGVAGHSYRDAPSLVIFRRGLDGSNQYKAQIDIVSNGRRSIRSAKTGPAMSLEDSLQGGVWETHAEAAVLQELAGAATSAVKRLQSYTERSAEFRVIGDQLNDETELRALPDPIRVAVQKDLDQGFLVVSPTTEFTADIGWAWWKINPTNGTTLGVLPDGSGSTATENLLLFNIIIAGMNIAVDGLARLTCENPKNRETVEVCRNCTNAGILAGGGSVISGGIAKLVSAEVAKKALIRISFGLTLVILLAKITCGVIAHQA